MSKSEGLPPRYGRSKTTSKVPILRTLSKSSSMDALRSQQVQQESSHQVMKIERRDSDDSFVIKQLESHFNTKPSKQSFPRAISPSNSIMTDANQKRSGSSSDLKPDNSNYSLDGEDDPYSTPARRRRIIADIAIFLLRQYCIKACKHVIVYRRETSATIQIQSMIRRYLAIKVRIHRRHTRQMKAALVIQCGLRQKFAVTELERRRRRNELTKLLAMTPVVQRAWRCHRARKKVAALQLTSHKNKKQRALLAACNIQRIARGYVARRTCTPLLKDAREKEFNRRRAACIEIQSICRMYLSMKKVKALRIQKQALLKIVNAAWPWCCRRRRKRTIQTAKQLSNWIKRKLFSLRLHYRRVARVLAAQQQEEEDAIKKQEANRQLAVAIRVPMSDKILKNLQTQPNSDIVRWCLQRSLLRRDSIGFHVGPLVEQILEVAGLFLPNKQRVRETTSDIGGDDATERDITEDESDSHSGDEDSVGSGVEKENDRKGSRKRSSVGEIQERVQHKELLSTSIKDGQDLNYFNQYDETDTPVDFLEDRRLVVTKSSQDIRIFVDCRTSNPSAGPMELCDTKGGHVHGNRRPPVTSVVIVLISEDEPNLSKSCDSEAVATASLTQDASISQTHSVDPSTLVDVDDGDQLSSDYSEKAAADRSRQVKLDHSTTAASSSALQEGSSPVRVGVGIENENKNEGEDLVGGRLWLRREGVEGSKAQRRSVLRLQNAAITFTMHMGSAKGVGGFFSTAMAVAQAADPQPTPSQSQSQSVTRKTTLSALETLDDDDDDDDEGNKAEGEEGEEEEDNDEEEEEKEEDESPYRGHVMVDIENIQLDVQALREIVEDNASCLMFDKEVDGEGDEEDEAALVEEEKEELLLNITDGMTLMQAHARGVFVRQMILRWDKAAGRIQNCWRSIGRRNMFRDVSLGIRLQGRNVAMPLQRRWRSVLARNRVAQLRRERCQELSAIGSCRVEQMLLAMPISRYEEDSASSSSSPVRTKEHNARHHQQTYTWTPPAPSINRVSPPNKWAYGLLSSLHMRCPSSFYTGVMPTNSMAGIPPEVLLPTALTGNVDNLYDMTSAFTFGDVIIKSHSEHDFKQEEGEETEETGTVKGLGEGLGEGTVSPCDGITEDTLPPLYRHASSHFRF